MSFNVCRLYVILMWIIWFRSQSSKQRINELTNKLLINFKVNDKIDFTTTIVVRNWFAKVLFFDNLIDEEGGDLNHRCLC